MVRLKKREPFVLSIQTNRNYEHAFSESLVALLSAHEHETTVQLVLTPAPGFVYRRARRLLKRRERSLQRADHRDPGELGIDSVVEAKELKGALELQHRSLLYFDLRVMGSDPTTVRRVAGLYTQLRSENTLGPRHIAAAPRALREKDRASPTEPGYRRCAPASCRPRSWRRCGSYRAPGSSTLVYRARPSGVRSPPRRSNATPTASCFATNAARCRSRRATASTAMR